ncbi:netrin-4 [Antennarius striatus]|uniref:netrin-4 n=1 Tax=Antennarius striatus TaxID=241820 RepID=UPI0035AFFF4F
MLGKGRRPMLVALYWLFLTVTWPCAASRCVNHACSPPMGNLASGRVLLTLSSCCGNNSSRHSLCPNPPTTPHLCPEDNHPSAHMTDDPFMYPDTWWASAAGTTLQGQQDEIRLDLDTRFCLSHVVLVFRSPRPAAMAVERSSDFGKTWEALKLFAQNCNDEFGLHDDHDKPGSLCTSRYTRATPCTGGEVILRTLDPSSDKTLDPYSPEALARLTLTNLRIRLLRAQTCPARPNPSKEETTPAALTSTSTENPSSAPYAIYSLLARGTCLCHGHAEQCVPHNSSQESNMVSGKCVCAHHTAGDHCDRCAPLYNDRPWKPANSSSGEANPCQKCQCHAHADSCHFSQRVWLSSGGASGGVCNNCRHNTVGRRCHRCRHGYRRQRSLPHNSPHTCTRCWCDPQGSLPPRPGQDGPWCHPRSGQCHCKSGVAGTDCSHCLPGYWGFGEEGCKPCTCPDHCDPTNGQCLDSYSNNHVFNVPIGGKIPDVDQMLMEEEAQWSKELSVSALCYTGKCSCKEKKLRSGTDLCKIKHDYVIKASVLAAHDKGSHAEVQVKVRKVFKSSQEGLSLGTISIYPLSWTSRGCTCPILNPGMDYLLAGPEEPRTGHLLVTMQSVAVPWTPRIGLLISEGLRNGCPRTI